MEAEVRIFTLNCWGLGLGISKDRDERMEDIGKYINSNEYDIVFCQVSCKYEDLYVYELSLFIGSVEKEKLSNYSEPRPPKTALQSVF